MFIESCWIISRGHRQPWYWLWITNFHLTSPRKNVQDLHPLHISQLTFMRKIAGCACAGNAGNVFPCLRFQRKPLVSDPGMHYGTWVMHVPWCISGSLTCGDGENVPGIPGACAPAILRIWQEAHGISAGETPGTTQHNGNFYIEISWLQHFTTS